MTEPGRGEAPFGPPPEQAPPVLVPAGVGKAFGAVQQFALWNPKDLGYLAGYSAAALASGPITGAEGEKFKAGKLGEYTIGEDGEVILGAPFVFKADNIDEFDF
ncbi:hypothetical protein [Streptosporangium roseum]|uniref:hypothetical protein n=1 Tax=Streptosporangium roseum TaxID=2001 RepID=UPI0001A3EEE1|nr:hypothetical protein [Streptosporangium roseum]